MLPTADELRCSSVAFARKLGENNFFTYTRGSSNDHVTKHIHMSPIKPGFVPSSPRSELNHDLRTELDHFATIARRRTLERDARYRRLRPEIERILSGFEWSLSERPCAQGGHLRAVAWNIERGKRFSSVVATLTEHPELRGADLVLLNEVDIGMGRSGNLNVPRELASALGLDYVYCNLDLSLSPGDAFERDHEAPNTLSLHGSALLTRLPVNRIDAVDLVEYRDKFHALEKRLGCKRALLCEVQLTHGPITVVVVHLDPFAPPRHRARQMRRILDCVEAFGNEQVLLGGDFNTNTYDLGSKVGLAFNLAHKFVRFGFEGTVRQYMTPEQVFERGLFNVLKKAGFQVEGYNDRALGTIYYDVSDPEFNDWTERYVPPLVHDYLRRQLRPWGGIVPMRLDWMAGRALEPLSAAVVDRPTVGPMAVSDHNPIRADFTVAERRQPIGF